MNNNIPPYPRMLTGRLLNHEIAAKQMKEQKPEALRLADELEMWTKGEPAAAELRRLHELNQELLAALKSCADTIQTEIWNSGDDECENHVTKYWVRLVKKARAAIAKGEAK